MNQQPKTKYHFDISTINKLILNNLEQFFKYFNLNLNSDNNKYYGPCPIHAQSDNPQAIIIYKNSGIWLCTTHGCEGTFSKGPIGLIRGLLSSQKRGWQESNNTDKVLSINDTINFTLKFLNKNCDDLVKTKTDDISYNEKKSFIRQGYLLKKNKILFDIPTYQRYCEIPSPHFLSRGYSPEILIKYNIGIMKKKNHEFFDRTIVPIFDNWGEYIMGLTARINEPLCLVCSYHHPVGTKCIDKSTYMSPKWEHNFGFDKKSYLFNYWKAKDCINKFGKLIIVEGPMDCVRLQEADICYSVALLGSNISNQQCIFIKKCNIDTIIIATDNDEGGGIARESIMKNLGKNYKYINIDIPQNDIGDLSIKQVQELFNEKEN